MNDEMLVYNMDTETHERYAPWKRYASPFFFTTAQRKALAEQDLAAAAAKNEIPPALR